MDVQVHIADSGAGQFNVVGLADKAAAESRERVRAALAAIGLALPFKRITVNLAPADLPKEGSHYDLPIALGLLAAMGVLPISEMANYVALGELSLDAAITAVPGVLPAAIAANEQGRGLICPEACGAEAAFAGAMEILAAPSLIALVNHMKGATVLATPVPKVAMPSRSAPDLRDVKGQESAKRALEISLIQSLSGALEGGAISRSRPFRNPHHSASMAALVGGGLKVKPGEVSLAHLGVLFLDELPEFARAVLDSLRQPIETGEAVIARANAHVKYPARFQLVAAMNPCRCGYLSEPARGCGRAPKCALDYQSRISGPLFDRIDLHLDVAAVSAADLSLPSAAEGSAAVARRVAAARDIQRERLTPHGLRTNAQMEGEVLEKMATPEVAGSKLLTEAAERMQLTARGYHRVLKVARTIADLGGAESVDKNHVAEALSYRRIAHL